VPFNSIPEKDFLNREGELIYLRRLPELKASGLAGTVILEGARGSGKTELLKQLYRSFFWEDKVVPFYYSFRTANLKGKYFARDYFSRFVRQYLSFIRKEPFIGTNISAPLKNLMPLIASTGLDWLLEYSGDLQAHEDSGDLYWQLVASMAAPAAAAEKGGRPVFVMLDDFDAAGHLYESSPGDSHGLSSLFEESLKSSLCPHVITGSSAAVEGVFSDHALIQGTDRIRLSPIPGDLAILLFRTHLERLNLTCTEEALKFLAVLKGNPLYIRNLAKAAWKMQKKDLTERDLIECYSFEVSSGETAFYWSSVFSRYLSDRDLRKKVIKLLMHGIEGGDKNGGERLSRVLGLREGDAGAALDEIQASGVILHKDTVLQDFIQCLYIREIEGRDDLYAREAISKKYHEKNDASCFELVIPMDNNAELVAARAIEQIGKNLDLDTEFLSFLQLALIEVCINAMEHSGSHDRKIALKFIAGRDAIELIIESPGRHFSLDSVKDAGADEKLRSGQKRGWGFKLISGIMDTVKVERVEDRTRIILRKKIKQNEVLK